MMSVRWLTNRSRLRCSALQVELIGSLHRTTFFVGRCTAAAIASASRKLFFCAFEQGRTYLSGINGCFGLRYGVLPIFGAALSTSIASGAGTRPATTH